MNETPSMAAAHPVVPEPVNGSRIVGVYSGVVGGVISFERYRMSSIDLTVGCELGVCRPRDFSLGDGLGV